MKDIWQKIIIYQLDMVIAKGMAILERSVLALNISNVKKRNM